MPKTKRKFKPALFRSMSSGSQENTNLDKPKRSAILLNVQSDEDLAVFSTPNSPERVIGASANMNESHDNVREKRVTLYTELNSRQKPQSKTHGENDYIFHHSNSALTLSADSKTRIRRYRHKRSKSHENYGKMVSFPKLSCSSYAFERVSKIMYIFLILI